MKMLNYFINYYKYIINNIKTICFASKIRNKRTCNKKNNNPDAKKQLEPRYKTKYEQKV